MDSRDRRLVQFVHEFARANDLKEFRALVARGVTDVVPADLASYTEVTVGTRQALAIFDHPFEGEGDIVRRFGELAWQQPLVTRARGDAQTISDYLTRARFRALEIYQDVYRWIGGEDQLAINLPPTSRGAVIGLALNRAGCPFTTREREWLNLLRPLLVASHERAVAVERARALLDRLQSGGAGAAGVVALSGGEGRIEFISERARGWLARFFGESRGGELPGRLGEWVSSVPRHAGAAAQFWCGEHRLDARLHPAAEREPRLLELRERVKGASVGLTHREQEILERVAAGETNKQIAHALGTSRRTVEQHLRSSYRKLGVTNRTAAVAALAGGAGAEPPATE